MEGLDVKSIPIDLILNILNIVIIFIVTKKLVYKPVHKFLDARKSKVDSAMDEALAIKAEGQALTAEYESKISDIDAEKAKILADVRMQAQAEARNITDKANDDAAKILAAAKASAETEKKKAVENAKDDITNLAFDISEKLLGRSINDADNKKLAESFFNN